MECSQFGITRDGLPIMAYKFGSDGPKALILGGVHGNEPEGVVATHGLMKSFLEKFDLKMQITLVPAFNLDGVIKCQRGNSLGIDLNRNLPTKDWTSEVAKPEYNPGPEACSEPENKALVKWLDENKPHIIYSMHSWKPLLNVNGDIHPEAQVIQKATGYEIHEDIGYPTPGCLGTYTGLEGNTPTLTYEIQRGLDNASILSIHVPAIIESLKVTQERFS